MRREGEAERGTTTAVRVAVAVAVHNRRELTLQCLHDLSVSDLGGLDLSVTVFDDGSTDGTGDAIRRRFPDVRVLRGDGTSFYTQGTNLAIAAALETAPDFVLAINDDARFPPELLQRLVWCAERHPRSIVGAVLARWDDPSAVFQIAPDWQLRYGGWRHRFGLTVDGLPDAPFDVELVVGNCVLVPRGAIAEVGLMDERGSPAVPGDGSWTPRMRRSGWRLLVEPAARLACQPNALPASLGGAGLRPALRALLADPQNPHYLPAALTARMAAAPTPGEGIVAFVAHTTRLVMRGLGIGSWPLLPDPPLQGAAATDDITRVVLAWPYLDWGGSQVMLTATASALPAGIRVHAVVPRGTEPVLVTHLREAGIEVMVAGPAIDLSPAPSIPAKLRRRMRDAVAHVALARSIARVAQPGSVLHVDLAPWSSYALLRWLTSRWAVIQTVHTSPPPLATARRLMWQAKLLALCRRPTYRMVAANGDVARGIARLTHGRVPIPVTPAPVDEACLERPVGPSAVAARRRLGIALDAPLVVGVGQLVARKGIDVLIRSMATLRAAHPGVRAVWIGDGVERADLEARIRRTGLAGTVTLLPATADRRALFGLVAAATVYVQPSREEGLPLALLDAMALGRPVVATRINAVPEAVTHDATGLLVPAGDADALAAAILALLHDEDRRRRLGSRAAAFVRDHHRAESTARVAMGVYRDARAAARRSGSWRQT